jgi:Protein of unknown function (DUF2510)
MPDAAWLPDPTGRFQYRYWDGTQWSAAVSRQGSQETDALSTQPPPPVGAGATPPPPVAWSSSDPAATRVGEPPPPPPGTAAPPPAAAPAAASPLPVAGFSPPPATGTSAGGGRTVSVGDAILGLGVIGLVVSIFLHWLDFSQSISGTQVTQRFTASGVPVQELVNYTTTRKDPTFLVLLIPIAALCVLALLVVRVRWLAILGGAVAVLIAAIYSYQLEAAVHASPQLHGFGLWDFMGIGPIVCFVAGVLAIVGAVLPTGRS